MDEVLGNNIAGKITLVVEFLQSLRQVNGQGGVHLKGIDRNLLEVKTAITPSF